MFGIKIAGVKVGFSSSFNTTHLFHCDILVNLNAAKLNKISLYAMDDYYSPGENNTVK